MTKTRINEQLIKMIPELKDEFNSYCSDLDGINTGSTIVMEDIFMPFFLKAINRNDNILIKKAEFFIDWFSNYYDDEYAGEVLFISIYENIHSLPNEKEIVNILPLNAKQQYEKIQW